MQKFSRRCRSSWLPIASAWVVTLMTICNVRLVFVERLVPACTDVSSLIFLCVYNPSYFSYFNCFFNCTPLLMANPVASNSHSLVWQHGGTERACTRISVKWIP